MAFFLSFLLKKGHGFGRIDEDGIEPAGFAVENGMHIIIDNPRMPRVCAGDFSIQRLQEHDLFIDIDHIIGAIKRFSIAGVQNIGQKACIQPGKECRIAETPVHAAERQSLHHNTDMRQMIFEMRVIFIQRRLHNRFIFCCFNLIGQRQHFLPRALAQRVVLPGLRIDHAEIAIAEEVRLVIEELRRQSRLPVEVTAEHVALAPTPKRAPRASKLDAFKPRVAELIARFPDITAQRVFEILRSEGFDGGYTAVKKHMRTARPAPKPTPSLTTPDYGPGEMAESDWSPYTMRFDDGSRVIVQALSYVLVSSTRKFFALYASNDLHALMDGHERAFERFSGCAARCKYDSQKPVVLRWEGNQPIYNPRFLAFSSHYEFRPLAVRRGHPDDKPRTERSFWEVERSFLNGRSFRNLDDMRAQLAQWINEIVDHRRRHKTTALERFATEREKLVALPRHPYDTARVVYRVCGIDGFVDWDGNRYAVPYDHVTDLLPVRVTQRGLFVYAADLKCVARHELAPRGKGLKLDPSGVLWVPWTRQQGSLTDAIRTILLQLQA